MTIVCLAEERWDRDAGAPLGPSFDITISSSRKGHVPYRVIRDAVTGAVLHIPRCDSWIHHGPTMCRHVQEGITRSEQPAVAFMGAVEFALSTSTWWASPTEAEALCGSIRRLLDEAKSQVSRNAAGAKARAASDAFKALPADEQMAAAVETFGSRDGGRS